MYASLVEDNFQLLRKVLPFIKKIQIPSSIPKLARALKIPVAVLPSLIKDWQNLGVNFVIKEGVVSLSPVYLLDAELYKTKLKFKPITLTVLIQRIIILLEWMTKLRVKPLESRIAEHQEKGRGRRRGWFSPYGSLLYQSIYWQGSFQASEYAGLTLCIGLAITQTLEKLVTHLQLKFPDHIYRHEKKLAGILLKQALHLQARRILFVLGLIQFLPGSSSFNRSTCQRSCGWSRQIDGQKQTLSYLMWKCVLEAAAQFEYKGRRNVFSQDWNRYDLSLNQYERDLVGALFFKVSHRRSGISCLYF